ncbi:MAG: RNA 2',3'-cyclic phosphodiesterase [Promethearchaeota archaeon]|nr:MAG: RNA 2',3'-cyclic phosphodiesterase [Candidatus Lokiarchaeota archaeon]
MIRAFIALELEDKETITNIIDFGERLKINQPRMKLVEPQNLHMTVKFLGNIQESLAPKIYTILNEEINQNLFQNQVFKYELKDVGQFRNFSVIWLRLIGDISFLQKVKDIVEDSLNQKLKIKKDKRKKFTPHLTIARLKKNRINYKSFDAFKKIINEHKNFDFGPYNIKEVKLKKSVLTPEGPIYSDLIY